MSTEDNNGLVVEHYESFVHEQDGDAVRKQLAPDFRDHQMPPGPEAVLQYRAMLHTAFPDLRIALEDIGGRGARSRTRHLERHAPRAAAYGAVASHESVTGMLFWRFRDGRIVERWATIARLGLQQQLTSK
jgi:predicted ester cyclase